MENRRASKSLMHFLCVGFLSAASAFKFRESSTSLPEYALPHRPPAFNKDPWLLKVSIFLARREYRGKYNGEPQSLESPHAFPLRWFFSQRTLRLNFENQAQSIPTRTPTVEVLYQVLLIFLSKPNHAFPIRRCYDSNINMNWRECCALP